VQQHIEPADFTKNYLETYKVETVNAKNSQALIETMEKNIMQIWMVYRRLSWAPSLAKVR